MPASDPRRLDLVRWHMAGGILILTLMTLRWVIRIGTMRPSGASTGNNILDRLVRASHLAFYVTVLSTAGTGLVTALVAGLPAIALGRTAAGLPRDFSIYPAFVAHGLLATLLANLILLHLLGVGYHQLIRRDRLLSRMR